MEGELWSTPPFVANALVGNMVEMAVADVVGVGHQTKYCNFDMDNGAFVLSFAGLCNGVVMVIVLFAKVFFDAVEIKIYA